MNLYYDELETRQPEVREAALFQAVSVQIAHAKQNAPAYQALFAEIDPAAIIDADAIATLPLTRKSSLIERQREMRPFAGLTAIPSGELSHIFASPGPIYEPGTGREDFWRFARSLFAAGFRAGDLIHNTFSYHLTPAGMMVESAARALGCTVIPAGIGQTELQLQTIADLKPQAYVGTPSFLKILLEKAAASGIDISSIRKGLVSGEALPASLREGFSSHGVEVLQCYALADVGVIAYESEAKEGLIVDEGIYIEIVTPGTGDPVAAGEVGEIVVTSLNPDYPLIRFATGDMSAFLEGSSPCGRTNRRIKGWMGRADQTAKVRGMFIHPEQIAAVVKRHREIEKARLVIEWVNEADQVCLKCETNENNESIKAAIASSFREICKVRAVVEIVDTATLPGDGIVIEDARQYE